MPRPGVIGYGAEKTHEFLSAVCLYACAFGHSVVDVGARMENDFLPVAGFEWFALRVIAGARRPIFQPEHAEPVYLHTSAKLYQGVGQYAGQPF